jgi:hypothetical protein
MLPKPNTNRHMKKLIAVLTILMLATVQLFAQNVAMDKFNLGSDSYYTLQSQFVCSNHEYVSETINDSLVLSELYVENYKWNGWYGDLTLCFGNGVLYAVKFDTYQKPLFSKRVSLWKDEVLYKEYEEYWN